VCGHWYWENDEPANIVCRGLGYESGTLYTFGTSSQLPTLPVVAGFRMCDGGESNIFQCPSSADRGAPVANLPDDLDCLQHGCVGPDGVQGTLDDTVSHTCQHTVDQGAICHNSETAGSSRPQLPHCNGCGVGCASVECLRDPDDMRAVDTHYGCNSVQPAVFGCISFYTTQCEFVKW